MPTTPKRCQLARHHFGFKSRPTRTARSTAPNSSTGGWRFVRLDLTVSINQSKTTLPSAGSTDQLPRRSCSRSWISPRPTGSGRRLRISDYGRFADQGPEGTDRTIPAVTDPPPATASRLPRPSVSSLHRFDVPQAPSVALENHSHSSTACLEFSLRLERTAARHRTPSPTVAVGASEQSQNKRRDPATLRDVMKWRRVGIRNDFTIFRAKPIRSCRASRVSSSLVACRSLVRMHGGRTRRVALCTSCSESRFQ